LSIKVNDAVALSTILEATLDTNNGTVSNVNSHGGNGTIRCVDAYDYWLVLGNNDTATASNTCELVLSTEVENTNFTV